MTLSMKIIRSFIKKNLRKLRIIFLPKAIHTYIKKILRKLSNVLSYKTIKNYVRKVHNFEKRNKHLHKQVELYKNRNVLSYKTIKNYVRKVHNFEKRNKHLHKQVELYKNRSDFLKGQLDKRTCTHNNNLGIVRDFSGVINEANFALFCSENSNELESEVYIAHDVRTLLSAKLLKEKNGGNSFCDVIEIPSFFDLINRLPWSDAAIHFLNDAHNSQLRSMDGLITIGPTLSHTLSEYDTPVTVIQNYRYKEKIIKSNILREKLNISDEHKIVLIISTVASGLEAVLEAIKMLPCDIELVIMGKIFPKKYEEVCNELIKEFQLEKRVHVIEQVPYDELTMTASSADVGLIVREPEVLNNYISLPNRIFDYIFSSLPVCVPKIPDIGNIVQTYNIGDVVNNLSPEEWKKSILYVLENQAQMSKNAQDASQELIWENLEEKLYQSLGKPKSATFLGLKDLEKNNRTQRMALTLAKKGVDVIICAQKNCSKDLVFKPVHEKIKYKFYYPNSSN